MKVVSVNVGMPREVLWKGMTVQTGIFKQSVEGPLRISTLNLAGDRQADLTAHRGEEKAVHAFPPSTTISGGESCPMCHSLGAFSDRISPRKGFASTVFAEETI